MDSKYLKYKIKYLEQKAGFWPFSKKTQTETTPQLINTLLNVKVVRDSKCKKISKLFSLESYNKLSADEKNKLKLLYDYSTLITKNGNEFDINAIISNIQKLKQQLSNDINNKSRELTKKIDDKKNIIDRIPRSSPDFEKFNKEYGALIDEKEEFEFKKNELTAILGVLKELENLIRPVCEKDKKIINDCFISKWGDSTTKIIEEEKKCIKESKPTTPDKVKRIN